jgi:hypothetical protein
MFSFSSRSLLCCALLWLVCSPALSLANFTVGFRNITNNGPNNVDVASQLATLVRNPSTDTISFRFTNTGPVNSIIGDIYFEYKGLFAGSPTLTDSDGSGTDVSFAINAGPGNLPGGNSLSPPFQEILNLTRTSGQEGIARGINNYNNVGSEEWLEATFTLASGVTYAQVIRSMNDNSFRIGLHVQSIGENRKSDSFVTDLSTANVVPVPPALLLLLTACPALGWFYLRTRSTSPR